MNEADPRTPTSPGAKADRTALRHQRRFRRWALRLFASHLLLVAVVLIMLVATIDEKASQLSLFLSGLLIAIALPVWIVTIVLSVVSLVRREPRPLIAVGLLAVCTLLALWAGPIGLGRLWDAVESLG